MILQGSELLKRTTPDAAAGSAARGGTSHLNDPQAPALEVRRSGRLDGVPPETFTPDATAGHVLEYIEHILRWCVAHEDASRWAELQAAHADDIDKLRQLAAQGAPELAVLDAAAGIVADHIALTVAKATDIPDLVAWVAAARAVDDLWGDMFAGDWPALLEARGNAVAPNQIVVHHTGDDHLRSIYGSSTLAAGLLRRTDHPGRTARTLIFTPQATVPPIKFDFTFRGQLQDVMDGATTVATAHPNKHIDELNRAFPIRPHKLDDHVSVCVKLVEQAYAGGAAIVALPEYTAPEEVTDQLRQLRATRATLVVAGSAQRKAGANQINSSLVWVARNDVLVPADRPVEVLKRIPYDGKLGREELNIVASEMTVFAAGPWRLTVAICRDLCDDELVGALGQIGVNLLVVPACTPKTVNLTDSAAKIATGGPGIALIANGPRHFPGRPGDNGEPPPDIEVPLGIYCGPLDRFQGQPKQATAEPPDVCLIQLQP